ncbi:YdiK family protein [Priestia aryabhattai]|uniref:YdiK family protein n=1 Tax=Priestia aryabhattai TaxID=412384 RepID=UPI001C0CEE82|nr:YdiK family protein [Priestia aryabhattai]MBU3571511.1 YdiK family protein [Priestia aryabhattai]WDL89255.1 YdiK family protein [Priestia aryabhattai]
MKNIPLTRGFIYIIMGILFTYLAIQNAEETVWNFPTILFALVAAFDFRFAVRIFILHYKIKKLQQQYKNQDDSSK